MAPFFKGGGERSERGIFAGASTSKSPRRFAPTPFTQGASFLVPLVFLAGCAEMYRWPDRMDRPPPAPAARRPEPAPEGHYVIKPGDTLYSIAFRNQLDFRELAVWNDIGPDFLITPGQVIRLTAPEVLASTSIQTVPMERPQPGPPATATTPPAPTSAPAPAPRAPASAPPALELPAVTQWRWPTRGSLVKGFGDGNGKGVDIGGELGQPVLAAAAGKVVYSGAALKGYGELIIIKHDDVHLSAYGYNRRRLVGEGVMVAAGQPIAELGLGPEQRPALHFEIRRKGKPVDPTGYLPAR